MVFSFQLRSSEIHRPRSLLPPVLSRMAPLIVSGCTEWSPSSKVQYKLFCVFFCLAIFSFISIAVNVLPYVYTAFGFCFLSLEFSLSPLFVVSLRPGSHPVSSHIPSAALFPSTAALRLLIFLRLPSASAVSFFPLISLSGSVVCI